MEINSGLNRLIQDPNQVYHDSTLRGKGTKESPLKVSVDGLNIVVDGDSGLTGEGTASNPLTIIPEGAILAEDGSPILTEEGEFLIAEGYVQQSDIKKYVVILSQFSTNAPVAIVLENTLGGVPVWSYSNTGSYVLTLAGAFPEGKVWKSVSGSWDSDVIGATLYRANDDTMELYTYNNLFNSPDDFGDMSIEIRVYP